MPLTPTTRRRFSFPIAIAVAVWSLAAPRLVSAQSLWQDEPSAQLLHWRLSNNDVSHRLLIHEPTFIGARTPAGCEHVRLIAGHGTHIHLVTPLSPLPLTTIVVV